jgi:hypothetical protein
MIAIRCFPNLAMMQPSTTAQLAGSRTSTQLGRLFEQLQITSIAARSPQAKGRIERLWGTFQDRLVSVLRLAGATTLHEANALVQEYLPRFNARFAVPAADPGLAWQPLPATLSLDDCFCLQEERTVALDNTISYHSQRVQLLPTTHRRSWVRCKVLVPAHFDGQPSVFFQGQSLPCRVAPADPAQLRTHITQAESHPSLATPGGFFSNVLTFLVDRKGDIFIGP